MESKKFPAFMFYPGDWMKDPLLRCVSPAARGLWIDMLCLMHESAHRGFLELPNGEPMTALHIGRMTGIEHGEVESLLSELRSAGVFSGTERGTIFSRRMARDESKRVKCKEAGKRGGNPNLKNNEGKSQTLKGRSKGGLKGHPKGDPNRIPTPSFAVSVSDSDSDSKDSPLPTKGEVGGKSPVQSLVAYFYDSRMAKIGEKPACFNNGILGKAFKNLLASFDEAEIRRRIDNWFQSTDPFIVREGFREQLFSPRFNSLGGGPLVGGFGSAKQNLPAKAEQKKSVAEIHEINRKILEAQGLLPVQHQEETPA